VSDPVKDDLNHSETCGLLRPRDQTFLAGLAVVAGLALAAWWFSSSGPPSRLIEWSDAPSRPVRFEVNVNAAQWPELSQLPEIGETMARRIVENRRTEGPFTCPADLTRVHGIGEKTLDHMRPFLSPESWPATESGQTAASR
jgi:competence protein ComEA